MLKFAEVNRYQKILIKSSLLLFVLIFVFVFNLNYVKAATQWESDPANCNVTDATNFPGQNCSPTNICGDDSGIAQCYDTPVLAPPSVSATSNTLYSSSYPNGGYIVNCYASVDSTAPYCDNNGSYWCNRSNDCYNNQNRTTVCTADAWATASCGTCRSGFADCDAGGDACEIEFGVTDYPTGANNNYADCTTAQCDSGWLDCDATGPGAGNGCEIQDGSSCTIGGLPGEYNGCSCEVPKQYFETGTDTVYSTSDPLLWGTQYGLGDLIHFGTDLNPDLFMVNNDGAVQMAQITEPTTTIDRLYNVGGDLYWNGSPIGSGSGSEQTLQDVADYSISTEGYVYADFGAVEFEDDGGAAKYAAQPGGFEFEMVDGSSGSSFSVKSESSVGADDGYFRFSDQRPTTRGLEYAADYSTDFTDRSLVDKGYVDGLSAGAAGNGLTWDAGNTEIDLGGSLTESTVIDAGFFQYRINANNSYTLFNQSNVAYHINDGTNNTNWVQSSTAAMISGTGAFAGIEYQSDYSANYTDRSLVDKAYVDGLASGSLWDTDIDTGIQVEEIADEDMIRFDIGNSSGTAYPDAMVINNLGNVGVATSSPTSMFHIDDAPENMNQFKITSGGQRIFHVDMEPSGPGGSIKMGDIDAGTYGEVFTLDHSEGQFYFEGGNVGISNSTPHAMLDIGEAMIATPSGDTSIILSHDGGESYIETLSGDMSEGLLMHGTVSATTDSGIIKQIYSNGYTNGWVKGLHIFNKDAEPIIFKTSDTEVARLDASGNLGVGTTSPQSKVDIYAGDLRLSNTSGAGCLRYNNTLNQLEYSNDCTTFNSFTASSGGGWTDDGSVVRLTTGTDQVVVGANTDSSGTDSVMTLTAGAFSGPTLLRLVDNSNSDIQSQFFFSGNALVMQGNSAGNGGALLFRDYNIEVARMLNSGMVINESGDPNIDFRVEGDTDPNLFYIDAGTDQIGLGNNSPNAFLDISSSIADAIRINPYGINAGNTGHLEFMELAANGSNYVGFKAPENIATDVAWVLPNADGSNGEVLSTDGTGNLSWVSAPAPTVANGLYNDTGTIKLGGDLTETTYINHMGWDFVVREFAGEPATYFAGDNFKIEDTTNDRVVRFGTSGADYAGLSFESSTNEHNIYYRDNALHITSDNLTFAGLQYASDYSADYTARSLVDKGYVDSLNTSLWDLDGDTGIQVEETPDDDLIRFDNAGSETFIFEPSRISMINSSGSVYIGDSVAPSDDGFSNYNVGIGYQTAGSLAGGTNNQMIGLRAGYNTVGGDNNTFIGTNTGFSNTSGGDNVFIGYEAGYAPTTQSRQVSIGYHAGRNNTGAFGNTMLGYIAGRDNTGNNNIFLGYESGVSNTGSDNFFMGRGTGRENSGSQNVFLGYYAGYSNAGTSNIMLGTNAGSNNIADDNILIGDYTGYNNEGGNNIFIGDGAGRNNITGTNHVYLGADAGYDASGANNVFIGYQAGYNETGSNILYIENSDSVTPLVYGQFDNDILRINGTLQVGHPSGTGYALPATDGSNGQYLQTDGAGAVTWVDASTPTVSNGIIDDAGTLKLGGTLSENTSLDRNAGISFRVTGTGSSISLSDTDNEMKFTGTNGPNGLFIDSTQAKLYYDNDTSGVENSMVVGDNTITVSGRTGFAGIEYDQDYSANYTDRSLVDKAYADSLVGGSLWDTDGDTGIQVEEIADEDIIRFDLGTASPNVLIMSEAKGFDWTPTATNTDFRVRGLTDDNLIFADVSGDNVGMGVSGPNSSAKLEVAGNVMLTDYLYFNNVSTDYIGHNGSEFIISDDLIPASNGIYILGSDTSRWKTGNFETLDVSHDSGTVATFNRDTDDGTLLSFAQDGVTEGTITVSGNTVSYNAFTGSHYVLSDETITKGMLVELTGKNQYLHNDTDSEILYGVKPSSTLNSPKILGSYLSKLEPKQKQSTENPSLVMAEGNGDLWVVDTGDDIEAGDYLISSDVEGHAQLVDDNFAVNYVVARAAEDVDWSEVNSKFSNKKHKLISVFFDTLVINTETVKHIKYRDKQGSLLLRDELDEMNLLDNINDSEIGEEQIENENQVDEVEKSETKKEEMQFGQTIVKSKQIRKKVKFNKAFSNKPIVLLTLASDSNLMRYYVSNVDEKGFSVNIYPSQLHDTLINWQALPNQNTIDVEDKKEDIGKKKDYTIIDAMTDLDAEFGEVDENNLDNNSNVLIIDDEEEYNEEVEESDEEIGEMDEDSSESVDVDESIDDNETENQKDENTEKNNNVNDNTEELDNNAENSSQTEEIENVDNPENDKVEKKDDNKSEVESELENEVDSEENTTEDTNEVNIEADTDINNVDNNSENIEEEAINNDEEVDGAADENIDSLSKYLLKNALALTLD